MLELWKKKCTVNHFNVHHEAPSIFVSSQWQQNRLPNLYYLIYRWAMALFFTISLIFSIVDLNHLNEPASARVKWMIFLTNWGFATCTVETILGAVMISSCFLAARNRDTASDFPEDNKALKLYKLYWVSNNIATVIAFGITIIYWVLIHDAKKNNLDEMNVIVHVFNSICMLIDLFVVAHPIRFFHFYWPVLYGIVYVVFSVIYYAAGGTSKEGNVFIYPILDWSQPGKTTIVCILVTLFIIFLHVLTYGLYRLRKLIFTKVVIIKDGPITNKIQDKEVYNNHTISSDVV